MSPSTLLIRADASSTVGTGHVMRMLALAQAWRTRGGRPQLVARDLPESLQGRLQQEGVDCHRIDFDQPGSPTDAVETIRLATELGSTWVIADGYHFGKPFQTRLRHADFRVAIVTDYDYCDEWCCDLIVNQNPHACNEPYRAEPGCQRLLGTRYALLRDEFLGATPTKELAAAALRRVLITLGGSDIENMSGRILQLLEQEDVAPDPLDIRLLVGSANPHSDSLSHQVRQSRHRIELMRNVSNMATQYQWTDALIGAGGSSCWEWMHAGLPAAIIVIADNQQPIYDHLTTDGIAVGLGRADAWDDSRVGDQLAQFLASLPAAPPAPDRFRHLVDGNGAQRLAAAMDSGVWLRSATEQDCRRYFQWANDPVVRAQSLTTDVIQWESHCRWFAKQMGSPDTRMWVAMRDERPVGQIRLNRHRDNEWIVSFSVAAEARGSGVGKQLLTLAAAKMQWNGSASLLATVRVENDASAKCFRRLGWQPIESADRKLLQFRHVA